MKYRLGWLGTLILLGMWTAAPLAAGQPVENAPIFEQRNRLEYDSTIPDAQQNVDPTFKDTSCGFSGWHCIVPEAQKDPPYQYSPAVFRGLLWAISKYGHVAASEDVRTWHQPETVPPFAASGFEDSPEYQVFSYSGLLWVLRYDPSKDVSGRPGWSTTGLWMTRDGDTWEDKSQNLPGLVGRAKPVQLGNSMVLVDASSVWRSEDGMHWTHATERAPWGPRAEYSIAAHDGALFLIGGKKLNVTEAPGASDCTDVWRSTDAAHWECVNTDVPFHCRVGAALASYREYLWLVGGAMGSTYRNDTWVSRDGRSWHCLTQSAPWSTRGSVEAVDFGGFLWLVGGRSAYGYPGDAIWSTSNGKDWQDVFHRLPWTPRAHATILRFKDSWWMMGGSDPETFSNTSNSKQDVWRTTDWKAWEQVGTLPGAIQGKRVKFLAGTDVLWIVTLASGGEERYQLEVWRSEDGVLWTSVDTNPNWLYWEICAAEILDDTLLLFSQTRKELREPGTASPWMVNSSRDGKRWKTIGSIPYPSGAGYHWLETVSLNGTLWAYSRGGASRDLWRSDNGKDWVPLPMDTFPEPFNERRFLGYNGFLWLIDAEWNIGDPRFEGQNTYALRDWWRLNDGAAWERIPFARALTPRSSLFEFSQEYIDSPDGLIMVDTRTRSVYRWDPGLAESCYIPNAEDVDIGRWISSMIY